MATIARIALSITTTNPAASGSSCSGQKNPSRARIGNVLDTNLGGPPRCPINRVHVSRTPFFKPCQRTGPQREGFQEWSPINVRCRSNVEDKSGSIERGASTSPAKVIIPIIPDAQEVSHLSPESRGVSNAPSEKAQQRMRRVRNERRTYLAAAVVSSVSFICLAAAAVVYRFASQVQDGGDVPYLEVAGTFALAVGAAVGMEFWARWAHKALWHGSLWHMHESHHRPREGPFELNDVFAIINAGPAIGLLAYGFFFPGMFPGLCFGAGLGITMFGMAYMFVHDGLVHRRFPVGPVADVPYLQRVAAAHQLHHADKFQGVPFGLFLGPQELVDVGGLEDLEDLLTARKAARS